MEILGSEFLEIVKNEQVLEAKTTLANFNELDFTAAFAILDQNITKQTVTRVQIDVSELVEGEPLILGLETSVINLPLRYTNALTKLVDEETMYPVNVYMIVEHPMVSQSSLFIQKAASVAAYLDDPTSVQERIKTFFSDQVALIKAGGWESLVQPTTDESVQEPTE